MFEKHCSTPEHSWPNFVVPVTRLYSIEHSLFIIMWLAVIELIITWQPATRQKQRQGGATLLIRQVMIWSITANLMLPPFGWYGYVSFGGLKFTNFESTHLKNG